MTPPAGPSLPRPPGTVLRTLARLLPGVARVQAQALPYAWAWHEANRAVLATDDARPLWVVLGDSMSQGLGAAQYTGGWVGQLTEHLAGSGRPHDVVNLSVTGARIRDVLDDQLPRLGALGRVPDLVTVLIGSNDLAGRRRRRAPDDFAALLAALPASTDDSPVVVAALPRRNRTATEIDALVDHAAARGLVRVADLRVMTWRDVRGTLADDFFHPNERGYATIARAFGDALDLDR